MPRGAAPPVGPERAWTRWALALTALGLVLAMPVATWWLIGDLSTVSPRASPDYAFRPWRIGPAVVRTAGIGSLVVGAATMVVLLRATFRHMLDALWWAVLVPVLCAGLVAGAGRRVMTAAVIGANIGAGFVIIFGGPLVFVLMAWALAYSLYLLARARRARSSPSG